MVNQFTPPEKTRSYRLQVNLTPSEYEELHRLAEETDRTMSSLARAAIRVYADALDRLEPSEISPTVKLETEADGRNVHKA